MQRLASELPWGDAKHLLESMVKVGLVAGVGLIASVGVSEHFWFRVYVAKVKLHRLGRGLAYSVFVTINFPCLMAINSSFVNNYRLM